MGRGSDSRTSHHVRRVNAVSMMTRRSCRKRSQAHDWRVSRVPSRITRACVSVQLRGGFRAVSAPERRLCLCSSCDAAQRAATSQLIVPRELPRTLRPTETGVPKMRPAQRCLRPYGLCSNPWPRIPPHMAETKRPPASADGPIECASASRVSPQRIQARAPAPPR